MFIPVFIVNIWYSCLKNVFKIVFACLGLSPTSDEEDDECTEFYDAESEQRNNSLLVTMSSIKDRKSDSHVKPLPQVKF